MRVSLLNCTPYALETLLMTKSTRLKMSGSSLDDVIHWDEARKMKELAYMLGTIKSSWEFVDYIFLIEDVSRAFTHQLVRHRVGTAFAQQAQRVVNMSDFDYVTTGTIRDDQTGDLQDQYNVTMTNINDGYQELLALGANPQDARGVLPTNICTNIIFKANLRTLHQMCGERLCVKAQGEFQDVMREIRKTIISVHPWTEPMLRVYCATNGVCCFPSYHECPIQPGVFNPDTGLRYDLAVSCGGMPIPAYTKQDIHDLWEVTRAEAQPTGLMPGEEVEEKK